MWVIFRAVAHDVERMTKDPQDLQGHYAALRLPPGAGPEEVEQAYQAREEEWRRQQDVPRFQVQAAYRFLRDPENKAAYDALRGPEAQPPSKRRPMILGGLMMFLFVIGGFVLPGFLLGVPPPFHAGDVLVHSNGKDVLGVVRRLESSHHFPNAMIGAAYLVESPNGEQRWYPAGDLDRHYHRRPAEIVTSAPLRDGQKRTASD